MKFILESLKTGKEYRELSSAVKNFFVPAVVTGLSAIHKAVVTSALSAEHGKKVLYLCSDEAEANRTSSDLNNMGLNSVFYPLRDFNFRDTSGVSHDYERQRLAALGRLLSGKCSCVVTTIDAALQMTIPEMDLIERTLTIEEGQEISQSKLIELLSLCGYSRSEQIDGTGQFSHRGGIIDFFSPATDKPVRIEFWGDDIDSISYFDLDTQRRDEKIEKIDISPAIEIIPKSTDLLVKKIREHSKTLRGKTAVKAKEILEKECQKLESGSHISNLDKFISLVYEKETTLFDYFSRTDSLLVFSEGNKLKEKVRISTWQIHEDIKDYLAEGILCKGLDKHSEDWVYALSKAEKIPTLMLDNFARGTYEIPTKTLLNMSVKQLSVWGGSVELLKEDLQSIMNRKLRCVVLVGGDRAGKVLEDDLRNANIPAQYVDKFSVVQKGTVVITTGFLSSGFEIPFADLAVISHGKMGSGSKAKVKKSKKDKNAQAIYSLAELNVGDFVVQSTHGIGIFQGIHQMDVQGMLKDYIKIEYAKKDALYVPVTQLDTVAKYIGPREDGLVKVHRLGGAEWQKAKSKVRSAVKNIAKELIKLYAQRMEQKGFAFPEDDAWQQDFEAHFEYEETDDQLRCIAEIKNDMESIIPMDRLLCGDVGFGKTEVALRAAFKCITAGKQCALLVPTTVLAWQHFQTVLKRLGDFPIKVELLSRFRTTGQKNEILRQLRRGDIDMIIGTHRIISKDVIFRDLGLAIIDEEQRFGVAQKEKMKEMCKTTDVLTLSATPIPRTLNMALSGIRDMSVIDEPPQDRHPVQTYVLEHDDSIIADAIRKELRRGGQVFYLHNDVDSISGIANGIFSRVPEARVGIGHGKMNEKELSEVWRQMVEHEIDVLVCTTIIETGVDVPNANTLIIDNADRLGLSQLHQIRGRVGRSSRRAFAYFTYAQNKILTEIAQKRLSAIREFTEFGSGFKIAMRDLEIRGAGNVLGGEQHGHMESVGYDMYLKLLNEAVALMKGEDAPAISRECAIDLQIDAHIPEKYISSTQNRLEIYRRIADIQNEEDSQDVMDELIDRFGEPPTSVEGLIKIALLRNKAISLFIKEVRQRGENLLIFLDKIEMETVTKLVSKMKGEILLSSSGTTPYLSVKLKGRKSMELLETVLNNMQE
ncbi:MAG: transcription-repair coupling factor [Clostridia bacterium]